MGFEYEATSLQMMAAGTGSSQMLSEIDEGNMEHFEQIFSQVKSVQQTSNKKKAGKNPEQAGAGATGYADRKQHVGMKK